MSEKYIRVLDRILLFATLFATYFFWTKPYVLIAILVFIAAFMFRLGRVPGLFKIYVTGFLFGPLAEALMIYGGSGATPTKIFSVSLCGYRFCGGTPVSSLQRCIIAVSTKRARSSTLKYLVFCN